METDIEKYYQNIKKTITKKFPHIVVSVIVFIFILIIAKYIKTTLIGYNKNDIMIHGVSQFVYYVIIGFGIVIILMNFGMEGTSIITLLASFGFAIALASQGVLGNLISGIYISLNNLYKIEDRIMLTVNQQPIEGVVKRVNLFNTAILNDKNNLMIIPNNAIQSNVLTIKKPVDSESFDT